MGSPWVGFDHFKRFFSAYNFKLLLMNTLGISVYSILAGFPIPIIFALMLNYVKNKYLKKTVQMVSYAPYFISTVVMCGMITIFMGTDSGIFNIIRGFLGMEPVDALSKPGWFKSIYRLKSDCRTPRIAFTDFIRLRLFQIFFKENKTNSFLYTLKSVFCCSFFLPSAHIHQL